jgi:hypothetical protein
LADRAIRIVAQIDDEALQLLARLEGEIGDRLFEVYGSRLVEQGNSDETNIVAFEPRPRH